MTQDQIEAWSLPTRPTKRTDTRAKGFQGESVEVDAIEPGQLRALVRDAIDQHVEPHILAETRRIEAAERETLMSVPALLRRRRRKGDQP